YPSLIKQGRIFRFVDVKGLGYTCEDCYECCMRNSGDSRFVIRAIVVKNDRHITNPDYPSSAHYCLRRDRGSKIPGISVVMHAYPYYLDDKGERVRSVSIPESSLGISNTAALEEQMNEHSSPVKIEHGYVRDSKAAHGTVVWDNSVELINELSRFPALLRPAVKRKRSSLRVSATMSLDEQGLSSSFYDDQVPLSHQSTSRSAEGVLSIKESSEATEMKCEDKDDERVCSLGGMNGDHGICRSIKGLSEVQD
ncbi:hypothetical protein AB6A40_009412, partial [Gnathostoma spinigerum]